MSVEAKSLATGTGTGLVVQVYQAPANVAAVIKSAVFTNTTAGALTFTAYANDGTASRTLIYAQSIPATSSYRAAELVNVTLDPNETFSINAAIGIDYWVSGIEIS